VAVAADPILRSRSRPQKFAALCHVKQAGAAPVLVFAITNPSEALRNGNKI